MNKIFNEKRIREAIEKSSCSEILKTLNIPMMIIHYRKGENIATPFDEERYFQIVVRGSITIIMVRDDGSHYSLANEGKNHLLGEMDLFGNNESSVFAVAEEATDCLAISINECREEMLSNNLFLRFLCKSLSEKIAVISSADASGESLEERVLSYMLYKCENNTLKGLEKTAFHLHCSARQLQRIMNRFVEEGIAEKKGKGSYCLLIKKRS